MKHLKRYYRVTGWQLVVLAVLTAGVTVVADPSYGLPLLAGGLVAIVSFAWFTWRTVADDRVKPVKILVAKASRNALEKYLLAACGFAGIFALYRPDNPLWVIAGYIIMVGLQYLGVYLLSRRP